MEDKEFYNELNEGDRFTKGIIMIIFSITIFAICLSVGINATLYIIKMLLICFMKIKYFNL